MLKRAEDRLWELIAQRTALGADTKAIDARIWEMFGEEWAVVATDLAGFSRRVAEFGIIHFLQIIHEHKKVLLPIVEGHGGFLVKAEADSLLLLFRNPTRALECAIAMQHACQQLSERRVPQEQVLLCVGIGFGQLLHIGESDVYGEQVNAASKLGEDTARAGEILLTAPARDAIGDTHPAVSFEPHGESAAAGRSFRVRY